MQLPFVARGTFDLVREHLARVEAQLDTQAQHWAERYDALLLAYTEMAQRQVPEPVKLPERTRDEVIEAILARAGSNGQLRAHLSVYAMKARREKIPDDQIIQRIIVWASPDDDDSSAGVP
jgi:hypothetical protein